MIFWRGRLLDLLKNRFGAVWGLSAIWGEGVDHRYILLAIIILDLHESQEDGERYE